MLNAMAVTLVPLATTNAAEHAARALLVWLAGYTVRGILVFLAAWVATALLRPRPAASRYAVWAVAVVMVAALPFLSHATPPIAVSVPAVTPTVGAAAGPGFQPAAVARENAAVSHARSPSAAGRSTVIEVGGVPASGPMVRHETLSIDVPLAVAMLWLLGVLCLILRFVAGTVVVWRRALEAEHVTDAEWVMLARDVARDLAIRRPVTLLMTRLPLVPVTWGIIYPVVLLPSDAVTWPTARRRIVLLHELAHVARFDAATQLVGQLVLAANWFNPLAWIALARMRAERERACDDVVLTSGTRASEYAENLLTLVRSLRPPTAPGFAALAMARHAELEGRLRFILDTRRCRAVSSVRASAVSLAVAAPLVLFLAALRPSPRLAQPAATSSAAAMIVAHVAAIVQSVSQGALPAPRLIGVQAPRAPALPMPNRPSSYRCPVDAEFIHGGVSADGGRPAALEAEHDDHRILVLADDGRCVSGRIDGQVALSGDASDIRGLGVGGRLTITEETNGRSRRAEVVVAGTDAENRPGYYIFGRMAELYVIDGTIVEDTTRDADSTKLSGLHQNSVDPAKAPPSIDSSSGYPMLTDGHNAARGRVAFRYFLDGHQRPWNEGSDWFHTTLAQLVRETAYDVRDRVVQLRLHGGVPAVLDQIRQIRSEMGIRGYLQALIDISSDDDKVYSVRDQSAYVPLSVDDAKHAAELAQSALPPSADRDRIVAGLRAASSRSDSAYHQFRIEKAPPDQPQPPPKQPAQPSP